MASLVQYGKYGIINKTYPTTMGYYVVNYVLDSYILQYYTIYDGKINTVGEIFCKAQYLNCVKANTKWYWESKYQQQIISDPTHKILNPCRDFFCKIRSGYPNNCFL